MTTAHLLGAHGRDRHRQGQPAAFSSRRGESRSERVRLATSTRSGGSAAAPVALSVPFATSITCACLPYIGSSWGKLSKRRPRSSVGMPGPLPLTVNSNRRPARREPRPHRDKRLRTSGKSISRGSYRGVNHLVHGWFFGEHERGRGRWPNRATSPGCLPLNATLHRRGCRIGFPFVIFVPADCGVGPTFNRAVPCATCEGTRSAVASAQGRCSAVPYTCNGTDRRHRAACTSTIIDAARL
jgi:hypothetical protein